MVYSNYPYDISIWMVCQSIVTDPEPEKVLSSIDTLELLDIESTRILLEFIEFLLYPFLDILW